MPDTNVWRYLLDTSSFDRLVRLVGSFKATVHVAPLVAYEALKDQNVKRRDALCKIMAHRQWTRLMPEVFYECLELRTAIQKYHPDWLRASPRRDLYEQHRADWMREHNGFWTRLAETPSKVADDLRLLGNADHWNIASKQSHERREHYRQRPKDEHLPIRQRKVAVRRGLDPGEEMWVEQWRCETLAVLQHGLASECSAYRDWLEPWLKPQHARASSSPWVGFLFDEISAADIPRWWIRSAVEALQGFAKWTTGTPADAALAAYLPNCDVLITGDRGLTRILNRVVEDSPVSIGKPLLLVNPSDPMSAFEMACQSQTRS